LDSPEQRYRQDCREQRDHYSARQNDRENGETRRHRGVKIRPPDPDGRPYSDGEAQY
jgi:hypothetical protein